MVVFSCRKKQNVNPTWMDEPTTLTVSHLIGFRHNRHGPMSFGILSTPELQTIARHGKAEDDMFFHQKIPQTQPLNVGSQTFPA